jgi:hypothetical protein
VDGTTGNNVKRTNAVRRTYQRTRNNDELRKKHVTKSFEGKTKYSATFKKDISDQGRSTAT